MKIGIIGAGHIGGTLARRWTKLGHEVSIANSRGPETLRDLAAETGAKAVTAKEAVQGVEVVVITIPQKAVPALPKDLFAGVPKDVIVIDTNNYDSLRDGLIDAIEQGAVESQWLTSRQRDEGDGAGLACARAWRSDTWSREARREPIFRPLTPSGVGLSALALPAVMVVRAFPSLAPGRQSLAHDGPRPAAFRSWLPGGASSGTSAP